MIKKHLLIILPIAMVGLVASYFLMPKAQELALMQMKDKHFTEARTDYETQLEQGKLNVEIATRLSELYLQTGDIEKAIGVMEKFVKANPTHLAARKTLGTYYQYAQRQDDYMRNLEEINKLLPKPENLKVLSEIYNFNTQYDKQAETLKKLIAEQGTTDATSYVDLASIYASGKNYSQAIATLQTLKQKRPEDFEFAQEELLVTLLFDNNQPNEAVAEADAWIKAHIDTYDNNARLISVANFRGNIDLAKQLLANYSPDQINASPALMETDVLLMVAAGQDDEAYNRLKEVYVAGNLSPDLQKNLLFSAVVHDDIKLAKDVFSVAQLDSYSETELVSLTELAVMENQPWLLKEINQKFPTADYKETMPILTSMLIISNRSPDADKTIAELDKITLRNDQILQIARVCARNNNFGCVDHFLHRLPPADQLGDLEVANVGDLYLDIHQIDKGYEFITNTVKNRNSSEIERVRVKYAAVRGDTDTVEKYLIAHKDTVSPRTMSDLYFVALNNKQLVTAVTVAEFYNSTHNTSQSRSYLSYAYVQTGQFAEAIQLLRNNKPMTEDDENNYIVALAKLSKSNPEYRKELTEFASAKLRSDISKKQKMSLVYALISIKEVDPVMPYIRELALSEGGQWASLYAETLDKQGKHAEARKFWVMLASQSSTSAKQKREIGFNLLNGGFKDDALPIFTALAEHAKPDSEAVKELLFLWGPRPESDKMAWLERHYRNAPDTEKAGWAALISDYGSAEFIMEFAERNPDSSQYKEFLNGYMESLVNTGQFASKGPDMRIRAESRGDTAWLHEYARIARANSMNAEARSAYESIMILDPNDTKALRNAGIVAFAQADYALSKLYLDRYIDSETKFLEDRESYFGLFYYGELLRRDKRIEEAKPYYTETVALIDTQRLNSAEALAVKAQSQIWGGEIKEGLKTFAAAREQYPNDDVLRADQAGALIDLAYYNQARRILAEPVGNSVTPDVMEVALPVMNDEVASYTLLEKNSELLIHFNHVKERSISADTFKNVSWVASVNDGYDTMLVRAQPGYALQIDTQNEHPALKAIADNSAAVSRGDQQTKLRYELLTARIDLETGHVYDATTRLNALLPNYKNDAQLLGFVANAENYGGNWPRAQQLLQEARELAPENEDLARLDRDMRRLNAPNIKLDYDWVKRGSSQEHLTGLSGFTNVTDHIQVGGLLQNDHIRARNVRRADGRVGNFTGEREQAELYALYHDENGIRGKLSFYANNNTAGLGGAFSFLNPLGETTLSAELDKPYWDFVEGVLDDATRDRLALAHTIKPTTRLTITGTPSYNVYNVDGKRNVISTAGADLDVVYRLRDEQPFLAVAYGLGAEYALNQKKGFDNLGNYTPLFPLRSTEIHFVSLNMGYDFSADTYGEMLVGYGYDRLGGNGPSVEGKLSHELNDNLDIQLRAFYGVDNSSTDDSISRIGCYVRWKF